MLDLYEEFLGLVEGLDQRSIDYALCGGLAVAVHGSPRSTIDIDLLVRISMTSNDYKTGEAASTVDMSSSAIATRLRRVSQLRRLCLSLGNARLRDENNSPPPAKTEDEQTRDTEG